MPFKMVTDSEKAAGRIAGTAMTHAEAIAEEQAAKWRDRLPPGQEDVGLLQLQRFHAEDLRRLREELRAKEAAHLSQLQEIRAARERRDAAVPRLRRLLYDYRDLFGLVYGDSGARALFKEKPVVPADATPLGRVGRIVVGNLENPDFELPPQVRQGARLSRSEIAEEISEPLVEMETAMEDLEGLLPLASQSLAAKRAAHAAVDEKSAAFARFLEGLYGLEGHDVLAAKVRPSSHSKKEQGTEEAEGRADGEEAVARHPHRLDKRQSSGAQGSVNR